MGRITSTGEHIEIRMSDLGLKGVFCLNFSAPTRLRARAEFDGDVYLGLYWLAIDQGLIKLPFPHIMHHSRHQGETAAHGFQVLDASIFVNEGTHRYRVSRARVAGGPEGGVFGGRLANVLFRDGPVVVTVAVGGHAV